MFCKYSKCSPEIRLDRIQKNHIYHIKQYQAFYGKTKCDLLNFRGVQKGSYQGFQYLMVFVHFFC